MGLAGVAGGFFAFSWYFRSSHHDLLLHKVGFERLDLTIVERGQLESADNRDVVCRVKAKIPQSTASSIKWVIDDGSLVKGPHWIPEAAAVLGPSALGMAAALPDAAAYVAASSLLSGYTQGQLLIDLDDSGLTEQLKDLQIKVDEARAFMVKAEEDYKIQLSENFSKIETAKINILLAELDLKKYDEGDYEQLLQEIKGKIAMAESDLEQYRDREAWSKRMVKKGYLSASQAQAERFKLEGGEISLANFKQQLRVLAQYTRDREIKKRENDLAEAKRALDREQKTAKAKEVQAETERRTKASLYEQAVARYDDIVDEIRKCKLYAPQDGIVVYYVPEQAMRGVGSQQSIIAQGENVREGQKLLRIPNLKKMLVNTKVHEAMIGRVKVGQQVAIRVDSFPNQVFKGHVEQVATVASQQDWFSSDVRVYQTTVYLDEIVDGIKPSMSAEVTITTGHPLEHVLTIPVQAIVGSADLGKVRKCFVATEAGPVERDIVLGMSNDRMAEITQGLSEGELVVINPKVLVGDKMRVRAPNGKAKEGDQSAGEANGKKRDGATSTAPSSDAGNGNKQPSADKKPDAGDRRGQRQQPSPEQQKQFKEWNDKFRKATPGQRKEMLEQLPEQMREPARKRYKDQGIEIAD